MGEPPDSLPREIITIFDLRSRRVLHNVIQGLVRAPSNLLVDEIAGLGVKEYADQAAEPVAGPSCRAQYDTDVVKPRESGLIVTMVREGHHTTAP